MDIVSCLGHSFIFVYSSRAPCTYYKINFWRKIKFSWAKMYRRGCYFINVTCLSLNKGAPSRTSHIIHITKRNSWTQNLLPLTSHIIFSSTDFKRQVPGSEELNNTFAIADSFYRSRQWICRALPKFQTPNSVTDLHKHVSKGYENRYAIPEYDRTQRRICPASHSCNLSSSHSAYKWCTPHNTVFVWHGNFCCIHCPSFSSVSPKLATRFPFYYALDKFNS